MLIFRLVNHRGCTVDGLLLATTAKSTARQRLCPVVEGLLPRLSSQPGWRFVTELTLAAKYTRGAQPEPSPNVIAFSLAIACGLSEAPTAEENAALRRDGG